MTALQEHTVTGASALDECSPAVAGCLDLIESEIGKFFRARPGMRSLLDPEDLRQELWLAAQQAHGAYDPSQGVPYPAYLRSRIHFAILQQMRAGDTVPHQVRRDWRAIVQSLQDLGAGATLHQMAAATGLTYQRAADVVRQVHEARPEDLDHATDMRQQVFFDPEEYLMVSERNRVIADALTVLPERQRRALAMRLIDERPIKEVAEELNVTPGRVSQMVNQALDRLRAAAVAAGDSDDPHSSPWVTGLGE